MDHQFQEKSKFALLAVNNVYTDLRHCHVNGLPRDQTTLSSTQTWFYCRYLGAVSVCDALT